MKYFINKYQSNNNSRFSSVINSINNNNVLVVGEEGNNGLIVKADGDGNLLWSYRYSLKNAKISFKKYVAVDNDEFVICGQYLDGKNGVHHLIMRVDSDGQPIWVKQLSTNNTRFNISIAKIGKELALAGWHNIQSSLDKIELHKINLQGDLLQSVTLDLGGDDQILSMFSRNNFLALVGGTDAGSPWDGFLTILNSELKISNSYLFNHPNDQSVENIQAVSSQGFSSQRNRRNSDLGNFLLGTSRVGNYTHTFIFTFSIFEDVVSINNSIAFDVTKGNDRNIKFIHINTDLFILGYNAKTSQNYVVRLKFANSVSIVWAKTFELNESCILSDIKLKNNNELWFSGRLIDSDKNNTALLIKTDFNLTTCKTVDLENVAVRSFEINTRRTDAISTSVEPQIHAHDIDAQSFDITKHAICDGITITEKSWVQSPYLYLQSAGSLGKDATKGFLLRWFFLGKLGDTHLPKGDYAGNTDFFNKPDDYVRIYRTKYDIKIQQKIDFKNSTPIFISDIDKRWVYKIGDNVYYLNYRDDQKYNSTSESHDPSTNPYDFLVAYGDGLLELEIREKIAFSVEIDAINNQSGEIKIETFSVQGNAPIEDTFVSSRQCFKQLTSDDTRIVTENIQKIVFQIINADLLSLKFEMYADFITEKAQLNAWTPIGKFALSKDSDEVYLRLEDASQFKINGHWQKYNDDAFVNIQNYKNRWFKPQDGSLEDPDGLLAGVEKFIQKSDTDPAANKELKEQIDDEASMSVSYFDLLQMASTDFHIARMLGLGTIDTSVINPSLLDTEQYVYLAEYVTLARLDDISKPSHKQHLFLTLPTALIDERLPQALETLPVNYGINLYKGTSEHFQLTDTNGYLPYEAVRYINIKAKVANDYSDYQGFFQPSVEFTLSDFSPPVFAGIEYRMQGEVDWRKPEISHDQEFKDSGIQQNFETLPVPFQEDATLPLLIHNETEEGIHEYSAYSINIFSRASQLYNSVFTDFTQFVKPNTLLPPHNLQVQLIQKESPNILTTVTEQSMLEAKKSSDKTLLRLTFLYTHLHDINYRFGNKVKIYFREELPRNIIGGIGVITGDANDEHAFVSTQIYTYDSTGQTLIPNVPPVLIGNFIGGVLVINENRYHIEDIILTNSNGDFPKFKIKKQEDRNINYSGNGNNLSTTQTYLMPNADKDDIFMAVENMALAESWGGDNPVGLTVDIGDASWTTEIDSYVNDENVTIENELRGIWDNVTITPKTKNTNGDTLPSGYYDIVFDSYRLSNHPQYIDYNIDSDADSVNWYKGIIRIPAQDNINSQKKVLEVVSIENIGNNQNLKLVIHDESYNENDRIQEGFGVTVNFYPGYRVYLHAEKTGHFSSTTILPQPGEDSKKTIIGLSSVDTDTQDSEGNDYYSNIGVPQILFAREILEPEQPELPSGPAYATPPDFYGKSTYTFATEFREEPFAAVFYRADLNAILKSLYKKDTLAIIKETLPSPDEDEFFRERLSNLVSFNYQGKFRSFPLLNSDYTFPNPDNKDNGFDENGNDHPGVITDLIKKAIINTFIPLTEQPLVYSLIKGGDYLPIPKKQTIRDKYGELLDPSDPKYDLSPMAKKIDGEQIVRFTDFTLDGEMSKNTAYFYCVREMGNSLALSEPSPILGPVQLINKNPPEAPVIRKITSQLANLVTGENTAVNFELNEYSASQNIRYIHIYRSTSAANAMTPRTMTLVKEIDLQTIVINDGIIQVQDDFIDDPTPPYGDTLYYKLVSLREVKYISHDDKVVVDLIPSKPSKTLLTNVVDVFNPEPPLITKTDGSVVGKSIVDLELKWNKTAYNAKYYLFKMNSAGNWNMVFEIITNDQAELSYRFSDPIQKFDEENDDKEIYHRFKVTVENASGLLNIEENILTI